MAQKEVEAPERRKSVAGDIKLAEVKPPQAVVNPKSEFKPAETVRERNPFLVAIPVRRVVEVEVARHEESKLREGESLSGEMAQRAVLAAVDSFRNSDIKNKDKFRLLNTETLVG